MSDNEVGELLIESPAPNDRLAGFLIESYAETVALHLRDDLLADLPDLAAQLIDRNLDPCRESAAGVAAAFAQAFETVTADVWRRVIDRVKAEGPGGAWRRGMHESVDDQ